MRDSNQKMPRRFPIVTCSSMHIIRIFGAALAARAIGLSYGQQCDSRDSSFFPAV
jgi:hypothetical protein